MKLKLVGGPMDGKKYVFQQKGSAKRLPEAVSFLQPDGKWHGYVMRTDAVSLQKFPGGLVVEYYYQGHGE